MTCTECPNSTRVYAAGGMYIECAAIRAMALPRRRCGHARWHVQVYQDKVFVPKECPITNEGANAKRRGNWAALLEATKNGHVAAVCEILGRDAEANTSNFNRDALMWAAGVGHDDIVKVLLNWGADVNARDSQGTSVLMRAVQNNHAGVVRVLLNWGANMDATDNSGLTALVLAAKIGLWDIILIFAKLGADLNAPDQSGMTALMRAVEYEISRQ